MRGRPKKPTSLHVLQGTFRGDRHQTGAKDETGADSIKTLRAPKWLDAYGRQCWKAHAPWLQEKGLLTATESFLFSAVCERWSTYRRACDELKKLTHSTEANGDIAKPQVAIAKTAFDQFKSGLAEFGVSPAMRSKVKTISKPSSKLDKYLSRKTW